MKIGIFDSGLGGLIILKSIVRYLPEYDYVYLGDTLHMPYGNKTADQIYEYTKKGVEFLFKQHCELVILGCNTASAQALRRIQQEFLKRKYKNKRVLGVIIPTVEEAIKNSNAKIGILGTKLTVNSKVYLKELRKRNKTKNISQQAAPLLASIIEADNQKELDKALVKYLKPLQQKNVNEIILACTHYSLAHAKIQKILGNQVKIYDQTKIIPKKLDSYIEKHRSIRAQLSNNKQRILFVTKLTAKNIKLSQRWFGKKAKLNLVKI